MVVGGVVVAGEEEGEVEVGGWCCAEREMSEGEGCGMWSC